MRKGQNEVLGKGVEQCESQIVVRITTMNWVLLHVIEHVVHPAHVPFQIEAQAAEVSRTGDLRPGCGFLGKGQRVWVLQVYDLIKPFEEGNRPKVFASPELVGDPLA